MMSISTEMTHRLLGKATLRKRLITNIYLNQTRPARNVVDAVRVIYAHLELSGEECLFPTDELMDVIEDDYRPDQRTVKARQLQNMLTKYRLL